MEKLVPLPSPITPGSWDLSIVDSGAEPLCSTLCSPYKGDAQ